MEHPVWKILKKEKYVEEFYPKAEEMYDFIQSLINDYERRNSYGFKVF